MKSVGLALLPCLLSMGSPLLGASAGTSRPRVVFETTTPYHHIRVIDENQVRLLSFDNTRETKMSLRNPLEGHFEYTEYFHMPWLWNTQLTRVLMIGLGGATTQRSFAHYYPNVAVDSVEIDSMVYQVATNYFQYRLPANHQVFIEDGRVFLRRTTGAYDLIVMDAYTENRYGSFLPQHLVTQEFFTLAHRHLTTNGVLAYNVIGNLRGWRADLIGAIYRTLKTVFPQVHMFQATDSQNVVLVATRSEKVLDFNQLHQRAGVLMQQKRIRLPRFRQQLNNFRSAAPPTAGRSPVLKDDFAPVDGLLRVE